ncbi:hypothetical protein [uncultured Hymenobacter sp.]|uniref:hypothetical protein n=1 Tax=uncultured Hymenobacter sp. TaxID=170016 RepID=UPI0035CB7C35
MNSDLYPRWHNELLAKKQLPAPPKAQSGLHVLAIIGLLYVGFVFTISLWEWLTIGVIKDKAKIQDYHFGTEVMMSEGGQHYASAEVYAQSTFETAIITLPILLLFILAIKKPIRMHQVLAVGSIPAVMLIVRLFNL